MKVTSMAQDATCLLIEGSDLVPEAIHVVMTTKANPHHTGFITISCGGCSWVAGFGNMSKPMSEWAADVVSASYLTEKLQRHKDTKTDKAYLLKIVEAVQQGIRQHRLQTSGRDALQP